MIVHFGNVLGSTNSAIHKFRSQITHRVARHVTHPDIIRYFMPIQEAAPIENFLKNY